MGSDQALQAAAVDGGSQLQCVPTIDAEVQWLLQRVDLGDCRHALEPFNGTGAISAALRAAGLAQVRTTTWPAAVLLTCMRMPCSLASIAGMLRGLGHPA